MGWNNLKIHLEEPLPEDAKTHVIAAFDRANINSPEGHWWGTNTEEDRPSHPRNAKVGADGTLQLSGIDFTEGRQRTELIISGDGLVIEVDRYWNAEKIKRILEEQGIKFNVERE